MSDSKRQDPPRPGLISGASSVFEGLAFLLTTPRSWPYAMVPALILLILFSLVTWASISYIHPAMQEALPEASSRAGQVGATAVTWIGTAAAAFLGILLSIALTPILSSPALDRIVGLREEALGLPQRPDLGLLAEVWAALKSQALAALIGVPIIGLLLIVGLVLPPLQVVTLPLKFVVASAMLSWSLFDYPLTLWGAPIRERMALINSHGNAMLGFGTTVALLFWLPCFGVLMLPVAVVAATHLLWSILESDPQAVPSIPRNR